MLIDWQIDGDFVSEKMVIFRYTPWFARNPPEKPASFAPFRWQRNLA